MANLQDSENKFYKQIIANIDPTLSKPFEVIMHYSEETAKTLIKDALIVDFEGHLADIIPELKKSLDELHINNLEKIRLKLEKRKFWYKKGIYKEE